MAVTKKIEEVGLNIHVEKIDNECNMESWFTITTSTLEEVDTDKDIAAQLRFWGIAAAKMRRIVNVRERLHRKWRSRFYKEVTDPDEKPAGWKKPTEKMVEAMYRTQKIYREQHEDIERAEEALGVVTSILKGLEYRAAERSE